MSENTTAKSKTRLYNIWKMMRKRCNSPNRSDYKYYGGRGIKVCEEWNKVGGFDAFREWAMKNGYRRNLSLDRTDTNGNYCPENCRWVARWVQFENRRMTKKAKGRKKLKVIRLRHNGDYLTLKEWSEKLKIDPHTLRHRYTAGWKTKDILETPVRKQKNNIY